MDNKSLEQKIKDEHERLIKQYEKFTEEYYNDVIESPIDLLDEANDLIQIFYNLINLLEKRKVLEIDTPIGSMLIKDKENEKFPGVQIDIDNKTIAMIEYESIKKNIQTVLYEKDKEEPSHIIVYNK
jgi:hypothetical protein